MILSDQVEAKRGRVGGDAGVPIGRTLLLAFATLVLGGCFQMVNVDPYALAPTEDVRVHLSPEAAERAEREFGTVGSRLIGRIRPVGRDSLALDTWLGQIYTNAALANARLVIPLHRDDVLEVQRRQVAVRRSVLAAGAAAAMTAIIIHRAGWLEPEPGDDDEPGPPPPPEGSVLGARSRIMIRIPIAWFGR